MGGRLSPISLGKSNEWGELRQMNALIQPISIAKGNQAEDSISSQRVVKLARELEERPYMKIKSPSLIAKDDLPMLLAIG
ncbi:uncharacterized protein A4U43_C04F15390, partial [Asparagus officinalis]